MKRRALAICAVLLLGLLPGSALAAAAVLDQYNNPGTNDTHGGDFGQTFTVGKTGTLTQVDLYIKASAAGSLTVTLNRTTGSPPLPGSLLRLATSSVPVSASGQWIHFVFTGGSVTAGQVLAIVFSPPGTQNVPVTKGDNYTRGTACGYEGGWGTGGWEGADFAFRTFVVLPASNPAPTPKPLPTATPTQAPTDTPVPTATPVATDSAGTPSPAASATSVPSGSSGSGGSGDLPIPFILAAIAVLALVGGGAAFVLLRRWRVRMRH